MSTRKRISLGFKTSWPQYSQHSKWYKITSKVILEAMLHLGRLFLWFGCLLCRRIHNIHNVRTYHEAMLHLGAIFYGLDACSAIAPPIFKMLENSIHDDPGTRNVLGFLRNYERISMKDAMGISVRIL